MKEKVKIVTVGMVVATAVVGGASCYAVLEGKKEPVREIKENPVEKEPSIKPPLDDKPDIKDEDEPVVEPKGEEEIPSVPVTKPSSGGNTVSGGSKPSLVVKPEEKPILKPSEPNIPSVPGEIEKPEEPSEPNIPSKPDVPEIVQDLVITNEMLSEGVLVVEGKKYGKVTISSDIHDNSRIELVNLVINDSLILEKPGKYQLDIVKTNVKKMDVKSEERKVFSMLRMAAYKMMNKALLGATINFRDGSRVDEMVINSNVHVNGEIKALKAEVKNTEEVVLNIPCWNVVLNTGGVVAINKTVDSLENNGKAQMVVNSNILELTNNETSNIRLNNGSQIASFKNYGEKSLVSGTGHIGKASLYADEIRIYTSVGEMVEISEDVGSLLVRKEEQIGILEAHSNSQGSVTFTLSEEVPLTISDLAVICNAGKSIELFNLTTNDKRTYTLTTSYFKNDKYGLYITLPNGNIISKDFDTDYANPTVNKVVATRVSEELATLELYGLDEGGTLYYILDDGVMRAGITADMIKNEGKASLVKVGYNSINIEGLESLKAYNLYYVIEGYFGNITKLQGPVEIPGEVKEENPGEIKITKAREEAINKFVFTLSEVPKKELTLDDFAILCPTESNLTLKGATFRVSPDRLTYVIVVPDNYGHGDNKYIVKINVGDNEIIEGSFVSHFNPPVITGAVGNVKRLDEVIAEFSFNSDEPGVVYYGVYEWNGGIYDYNSTTPFASDVLTGKISSKSQDLYAGSNTITVDLSDVTVTNETRLWALFVDEVGNYRVGFVDHYKIPQSIDKPEPKPDTTLDITNFTYTNKRFEVLFNEEIMYNVTSDDVSLAVIASGSLPTKILYIINNDEAKKVVIDIANYELPVGVYELTLNVVDKMGKEVKFVKQVEIK